MAEHYIISLLQQRRHIFRPVRASILADASTRHDDTHSAPIARCQIGHDKVSRACCRLLSTVLFLEPLSVALTQNAGRRQRCTAFWLFTSLLDGKKSYYDDAMKKIMPEISIYRCRLFDAMRHMASTARPIAFIIRSSLQMPAAFAQRFARRLPLPHTVQNCQTVSGYQHHALVSG